MNTIYEKLYYSKGEDFCKEYKQKQLIVFIKELESVFKNRITCLESFSDIDGSHYVSDDDNQIILYHGKLGTPHVFHICIDPYHAGFDDPNAWQFLKPGYVIYPIGGNYCNTILRLLKSFTGQQIYEDDLDSFIEVFSMYEVISAFSKLL